MSALVAAIAAMSSREIAGLTGKRHDNVMRVCRDLLDSGVCPQIEECQAINDLANGRSFAEFRLNKRDSLVLVARLSPEFTGRVVDRWIELEARAPVPVTLTTLDILEMATKAERERLVLSAKVEHDAPAVAFVERYVNSTGTKGFRQVCKPLGANENEFREFLAAKSVMYRLGGEWVPHAQHLDAGRFEVKAGTAAATGHAFNSARFTAKGVAWVAGEFAKFKLPLQGA